MTCSRSRRRPRRRSFNSAIVNGGTIGSGRLYGHLHVEVCLELLAYPSMRMDSGGVTQVRTGLYAPISVLATSIKTMGRLGDTNAG